MFAVSPQNDVAHVTPALTERLGRERPALVGEPATTLVATDAATFLDGIETARRGVETERLSVSLQSARGPLPATVELCTTDGERVVGSLLADAAATSGASPHDDSFGYLYELTNDAVAEIELVDADPIVRAVNPAFEDTFGFPADDIVGDCLNDYIVPPTREPEAVDFDHRTAAGKLNEAVVDRETADGIKRFHYRGIPYEDADGNRRGIAIYTDVSEQHRREQHHAVLHRIMRHNLRNDLTIILGALTQLEDDLTEAPHRERVRTALSRADDVRELIDTASTVQAVLESDEANSATVAAVVKRSLDTLPSALARDVAVDLDATGSLLAPPHLPQAVGHILVNALEHGGETVQLEVAAEGQWVHLTVADNGPGIPDVEREPVFEEAAITQLSHGSSVGLWLAKWTTESVGGRLTYDRTAGWTRVTFTLPRAGGGQPAISLVTADD